VGDAALERGDGHARWIELGQSDRVLPAARSVVIVDGEEILLVRLRRGVAAVANRCPHLGAPLDEAPTTQRQIVCRQHHYRYDLRTGRPVPSWRRPGPACARWLPVYPTRVVDGRLFLRKDEPVASVRAEGGVPCES
jgi:nitrite reductase/ring-hydroxylating ferredoxin subunit